MSKRKADPVSHGAVQTASPKKSPTEAQTPVLTVLSKYNAAEVMTTEDLLIVASEDPLSAFQKIVARGVLSAPVVDKTTGRFVSFLDTRDLVSYMIFKFEQEHNHPDTKGSLMKSLLVAAAKMHSRPLEGITVSYLSKRNAFVPVEPSDSLAEVARVLCMPDVRRVPVVSNGSLVGIVSQSNLIRFIQQHHDEFKSVLDMTLNDTDLGGGEVICAPESWTALQAFSLMSKKSLSSIPIVSADGVFIANTSGSDMKLLLRHMDSYERRLNEPVMDYLSALRQERPKTVDEAKTRSPTIICHRDERVGSIVQRIVASGIHKVFLVDGHRRLSGVVSVTDLLQHMLSKTSSKKSKTTDEKS